MTYTPGKWKARKVSGHYTIMTKTQSVATAWHSNDYAKKHSEEKAAANVKANAQLIAAAPELLEAL